MKLHLVTDFDLTLTKVHSGGSYRRYSLNELIEPDIIREMKRLAIRNGHYASVCTFGDSREMVAETLTLTGLEEGEVASVKVVTGLAQNKNGHITRAKREHGILDDNMRLTSRSPLRTLLLEDDITNLVNAANGGALVLLAQHDDPKFDHTHLETALKILHSPHQAERLTADHARDKGYDHLLTASRRIR